jgi:hypothetical protein
VSKFTAKLTMLSSLLLSMPLLAEQPQVPAARPRAPHGQLVLRMEIFPGLMGGPNAQKKQMDVYEDGHLIFTRGEKKVTKKVNETILAKLKRKVARLDTTSDFVFPNQPACEDAPSTVYSTYVRPQAGFRQPKVIFDFAKRNNCILGARGGVTKNVRELVDQAQELHAAIEE